MRENKKIEFCHIFGNNNTLQKSTIIFYIDFCMARAFIWAFWLKNVDFKGWGIFFDWKTCPKIFFCLRICKKLRLFCYWQNLVQPTFLGAHLLTETVFQLFWKIVIVICALSLGCMNYIFGKKFLVFYEIFQFPTSRGPFLGKFDFY